MHFDPEAFGKAMGEAIREAVAPLHARIADLEKRLADIPTPADGKDGTDGAPGRDGKDCDMEVVKSMLADMVKAIPVPANGKDGAPGKDGASVTLDDVRPLLDEAVKAMCDEAGRKLESAIKAIPTPKDGRDGVDGKDGAPGATGEKGADGKDGAGIADLMIDRAGELVATFTDGRMKNMGPVIGKDGRDGKDGADFSNASLDWDGDRTLIIRGAGGEIRKTIPLPLDKGYWRDGMACEKGDIVTHDGNAWIALTDNKSKPSHENKSDWRLFARRGRDGESAPKKSNPDGGPVKLKKDGEDDK